MEKFPEVVSGLTGLDVEAIEVWLQGRGCFSKGEGYGITIAVPGLPAPAIVCSYPQSNRPG